MTKLPGFVQSADQCLPTRKDRYCPRFRPRSENRQYKAVIPRPLQGRARVPMVVLRGYQQTDVNMVDETRFKGLAECDNFIVIYPFITHYPAAAARYINCWGFFIDLHNGAGKVEARRFIVAPEAFSR